jgi:hypothetical protein
MADTLSCCAGSLEPALLSMLMGPVLLFAVTPAWLK